MQIEKINENKLEIILNIEDLNKNDISLQSFMSNSVKNQNLLFEILNFANEEIGFSYQNYEIIVESFLVPSKNSFILIITRVPEPTQCTYLHISHKKYKRLKLSSSVICSFNSFEDFCMFCNSIIINKDLKSSLFLLNNTYYLQINFKRIKDIKHITSSLLEFTYDIFFNKNISENAQILIKDSALELSKKYFV